MSDRVHDAASGLSSPRLTQEQAFWVRRRVALWLTTKFAHERRGITVYALRKTIEGHDDQEVIRWGDIWGVTQLVPDADHSALLLRLLSGREPLPEPPPTQHSYPVYDDMETWNPPTASTEKRPTAPHAGAAPDEHGRERH